MSHAGVKDIGARRQGNAWTAEDDAELRALVAANVSITRMAVRLDRSLGAIKRRLSHMEALSGDEKAKGPGGFRRNTP